MDNNLNLLTELYDIKRQNIDWEIKLENNNRSNDKKQMSERLEDLTECKLKFILSDNKVNNTTDRVKQQNISFNNDLISDSDIIINQNNNQLINSSMNTVNDGIKNVEEYVERRKINGITWYYCKWTGCDYGSNKSNHLVRHVRTHTGEKPYSCDWPNCGKKFTDSWKRKDHLLSHSRKLMTSNHTNAAIDSLANSNNNNFKLFMEMFDSCNNNDNNSNQINSKSNHFSDSIHNQIHNNQEIDEELDDFDREDLNNDLNMFIPEVIVDEIDVSSSDNILNNDNNMSVESETQDMTIKSVEQLIERTVKNDKVWYRCKWNECSYGSNKSHHLFRHIRSQHKNERPFLCEWPECGKRFTDSYKLKEHQLTHYRKLITTVGNNNKTSMNLVFDLNNKVNNKCNDNSIGMNNQLMQTINGIKDNKLVNRMTFNVSDEQSSNSLNPKKVVMSIKNVEEFVERRKIDGITRYFCKWPLCTYGSNKSNHLVRHVRTHTNERPFICDFVGCGKKFTDSWKLRDHKICHNKNKSLNSTFTNSFEDQTNAVQNFNIELVENVNTPSLTNSYDGKLNIKTVDIVMSIKNVEEYVERRKVNGITFYYCKWTDCNYGSNKSNHLVRHVRTHTGERPYECDYPDCDKKFTDSWKLKDHKSIHAKRSLEKSNTKLSLVNCLQINANEKNNNSCDQQIMQTEDSQEVCSLSEDQQMDLLIPQVIIRESDETLPDFIRPEMIDCHPLTEESIPGILSIKNVEQYVEKMLNNGLNWYKCKWNGCDFGTQKSSYIVQHIYKHTGEKPYKCSWNMCTAKFNKKQNLTLHMMSHTGDKPLRCQYPNCYYTAVSSEALILHFRRHSGDMPFKCDWNQCEAQFGARIELIRHSKTHLGSRLHKCHFPNCSYVSKYRNKLTIHIRRHNNDRPFKCTFDNCGKCFIVRDKLRRHELTVHKMQSK